MPGGKGGLSSAAPTWVYQRDTTEVTPEDEQKARLLICSHAKDADDARMLMEMLGLLGGEEE